MLSSSFRTLDMTQRISDPDVPVSSTPISDAALHPQYNTKLPTPDRQDSSNSKCQSMISGIGGIGTIGANRTELEPSSRFDIDPNAGATSITNLISDLGLGMLEPTPITSNQRALQTVYTVDSLPSNLITCRDECIEALSHIKEQAHHNREEACMTSTPGEQNQQSVFSFDSQGRAPSDTSIDSQGSNTSLDCADSEDPSMKIHPYQQERWMARYQELVDYYRQYGHCNVPYVYKPNPVLGQWVKRQRHQLKLRNQGQHSNLTEERIQMLDMLGFIWDSHGAAWEEKFQELREFRKNHGHCNVPCLFNGTSKLSTWLKRQRRQYRLFMAKQPSTMDYERIAKLEGIGFVWDYYGGKVSSSARR